MAFNKRLVFYSEGSLKIMNIMMKVLYLIYKAKEVFYGIKKSNHAGLRSNYCT